MSLPNDVSRCVGRFGLRPDDPVCPRRESCQRYMQLAEDRNRWPEGWPVCVPVATGLCREGDDYMIEVAA